MHGLHPPSARVTTFPKFLGRPLHLGVAGASPMSPPMSYWWSQQQVVCHAVGMPRGEAHYTNRGSGHVRRHGMRSGHAVAYAGGGVGSGGVRHALGAAPYCSCAGERSV